MLFNTMMAMAEQDSRNIGSPVLYEPKQNPIPKGAKEYWFNAYGEFSTEGMLKTDIVFKCVAISDKSAKKKYERNRKQARSNQRG